MLHVPFFPLTLNWECSTKPLPFRTLSLEKKANAVNLFSEIEVKECLYSKLIPLDPQESRISHSKGWKLREKRYSSSLKVVKETVRKCHICQKVDALHYASEIFATKMEMREKVLTFLTHKSKRPKLQTMLVLVKVLSGQYHSYPLTQFSWTGKWLCKYYISMIYCINIGLKWVL